MNSPDQKPEKDEYLKRLYCFLQLPTSYSYFGLKMIKDRRYRLNVFLRLQRSIQSTAARGAYDISAFGSDLLERGLKMFNETLPKPEIEPQEPIQSYLNECTLRLTGRRRMNLTQYDNRRSGHPMDRYYFGIYDAE